MEENSFTHYVVLIVVSLGLAFTGLYLLGNFKTLFRQSIRNEVVRQNAAAWLIIFCFIMATAPMNSYFDYGLRKDGILLTVIGEMLAATINTLFVFNIVRLISISAWLKKFSFNKQRVIILLILIITTVIFNLPLNYIASDYKTEEIKYSAIVSVYMGGITGFVYILMTYLDAERSRKFQEKELELSRMNELKTKAELDALHSKVNPHFLYNALNSIADLSITDGKKARKMTIALADLFRYSINYSQDNFSTVKDEVAMTEVYLQIEKIRFEDQLAYTIHTVDEAKNYLIPRFMLQPLVENAVKHGLKVTGLMTEIFVEVKKEETSLIINIADNGPAFPDDLVPGYGVKSVFDKMDLLFPGQYAIHFENEPRKQVSVRIHKLLKNETVV